mgnify:CR=1 FL=1
MPQQLANLRRIEPPVEHNRPYRFQGFDPPMEPDEILLLRRRRRGSDEIKPPSPLSRVFPFREGINQKIEPLDRGNPPDGDEAKIRMIKSGRLATERLYVHPLPDIDHLLRGDRKSTRLNSRHVSESRMPSSA